MKTSTMNTQIAEILKAYNNNHLKELEEIEKYFHVDHFDNDDAFKLGKLIVEDKDNYDCGIVVVITREEDAFEVFRFVSNDKSQKNIDYATGKRNAVLKNGHCSVWTLIDGAVNGKDIKDLFMNPSIVATAGAFPIYVNEKHTYTVAVSGLHEGKDFTIVIKAMEKYLNKELPTLDAPLL